MKLTKAQAEMLRRLNDGERVMFSGLGNYWYCSWDGRSRTPTVESLLRRDYIYNRGGTGRITESGRAAWRKYDAAN